MKSPLKDLDPASPRRKRVMIVDDSPIVRERIIRLLSEIPEVDLVGEIDRAQQAVQRIRAVRPDVVILDISLPGGSGIQVLEAVKEDPDPPCVVMLTNFPHRPYRDKCRELGADYFFDKSNEFEKITEVLRGFSPPPPLLEPKTA